MTLPYSRIQSVDLAPGVCLGGDRMVLIAGPCVIELEKLVLSVAEELKRITEKLNIGFIFKSSFDKANRTSSTTFRSLGFDSSMRILEKARAEIGVPLLTDVHKSSQVETVAQVVDVLQIPAFLCRQTDLLEAAARLGSR